MEMRQCLGSALALGVTVVALVGCQTQIPEAQMTMPSPRYIEHPPQYVPTSPPFPLPRELASQEAAAAAAAQAPGAIAPAPPPAPVVPGP